MQENEGGDVLPMCLKVHGIRQTVLDMQSRQRFKLTAQIIKDSLAVQAFPSQRRIDRLAYEESLCRSGR